MLIFIDNAWKSMKSGPVAPNDPWDAATLEWALPSPPPEYNFAQLPQVTSQRPLWDVKYGEQLAPDFRAEINTLKAPIHMPNPSYWPMVTAARPVIMATGMILRRANDIAEAAGVPAGGSHAWAWVLALGGFTLVYGVYRWAFEPAE